MSKLLHEQYEATLRENAELLERCARLERDLAWSEGSRGEALLGRDAALRRCASLEAALREVQDYDCADGACPFCGAGADDGHTHICPHLTICALLGPSPEGSPCEHEWVPVTPGTAAPFMCSQCGVDLDDEESEPPEGTKTSDDWRTHPELRDLIAKIPDDSDRIRAFRLLNEALSPDPAPPVSPELPEGWEFWDREAVSDDTRVRVSEHGVLLRCAQGDERTDVPIPVVLAVLHRAGLLRNPEQTHQGLTEDQRRTVAHVRQFLEPIANDFEFIEGEPKSTGPDYHPGSTSAWWCQRCGAATESEDESTVPDFDHYANCEADLAAHLLADLATLGGGE